MFWKVFVLNRLLILLDQKSVDEAGPGLLVRTLSGAEVRRQAKMVNIANTGAPVIDDRQEIPVKMSSSSLPVCQNLTEHFNSVLVDIKFQQIWKLQFRYLNCIRLENPELFQVSRPNMEFSGWTDVDVECPQVWKIRQEDVNHVLRIIIVHYPLIQLNVGRKMNGK